ncbi:MAG: TIGR01244 family phosphatase [Alphaproteobacteria bacterium]|nr:TIGR01244 family phosphatase [Alphaproteobacteria bacterium]
MPGTTKITDQVTVSGQIGLADVAEIAKQGFASIINNRPDGEEPGQPDHETIAAEAKKHGLKYHYIPVVTGNITRNDVVQFQKAVLRDGPAFAHCRTGTRCYLLWGLLRALYDGDSSLTLVAEGARKGYDLRVLPALVEKLEAEKGA